MGIICLYVLIQKSAQKAAKSHLCALRALGSEYLRSCFFLKYQFLPLFFIDLINKGKNFKNFVMKFFSFGKIPTYHLYFRHIFKRKQTVLLLKVTFSNQILLVTLRPTQLTQALFLQKKKIKCCNFFLYL